MGSRTTVHATNAGGLIFCVRNGYRSFPAAMADVLVYFHVLTYDPDIA